MGHGHHGARAGMPQAAEIDAALRPLLTDSIRWILTGESASEVCDGQNQMF